MPAPARKPPARAVEPLPLRPPMKKPCRRANLRPRKRRPRRNRRARRSRWFPHDPAVLLAQHVDELGELEAELVPIRVKLRPRGNPARTDPASTTKRNPRRRGFEVRGARYRPATLGPRAWQSTVDYAAVQKALGLKAYADLARPTLKALEETLAPDVLARVVTWDYQGARPLKTFALAEK